MAARGARPPHQESLELIRRDFDGKDLWQFSRGEQIATREGGMVWSARQHHDWQLESFPAGYYSPENTPDVNSGNTLILTHTDRMQPTVADVMLGDDRLIEVSSNGRDRLGVGGERPHRRVRVRRRMREAPSRPRAASTRRGAASTGCTSTRRPMSDRTSGSTRATCASRRTTSSSAAAKPACSRLSAATAGSSGSSVRTSARRRNCARFGRSSASTTRI